MTFAMALKGNLMSKIYSVDGKLRELVTNADGSKTVKAYVPGAKNILSLFSDPKLALIAQNLLILTAGLDDDTGVSDTNYTTNITGGG